MIMPVEGSSPEDWLPPTTLDELNRRLAETMRAYNAGPDPEMGGLSPEQVFRLIHSPWGVPGSPIQFHPEIPPAELEGSSFFRRAGTLLRSIRDRSGVKATASKNLTRRFVSEMMDELLSEESCSQIRRHKKAINERDVGVLHMARVVSQCAGLIRLYKGKYIVPKKNHPLLAPERAGELFQKIFVAFFRKFNLAYPSRYGPEAGSIQSCAGYTLYRLGMVASDWRETEKLPAKILLPAVRDEIEAEIGGSTFFTVDHILHNRTLSPLIEWGLLEGRYEHRDSKHFKTLVAIRKTPLYDDFLQFKFG